RTFQVQNRRKPLRCQPTTVEAFMMRTPDLHPDHAVVSQAHNSRSAVVNFGRFTERCRTPIWWRNARISNWSAARHRNDANSDATRAVNMWPKGNRTMSDKSHFTNVIGVYENHNRWIEAWRNHPGFDFAIIPDVIEGSEEENDDLLAEWP